LTHAACKEKLGGLAQLDEDRRVDEETDWNAVLTLHSFRWREEKCDEWTGRLDGDKHKVDLRVDLACRRAIGREPEVDSAAEDLIDSRSISSKSDARLSEEDPHLSGHSEAEPHTQELAGVLRLRVAHRDSCFDTPERGEWSARPPLPHDLISCAPECSSRDAAKGSAKK
jgi:hypothetical protein